MEVLRAAVDHRVWEDRWAGLELAQPPGAFPEERRDDSGKGLTGPDAVEIVDLLAARLPDVAHPTFRSKQLPRLDWPPLNAAPKGRLFSEPSLREPRRASPHSDVQLPEAARPDLMQVAPDRHSEAQPQALRSFPLALAREQPTLHAKVRILARPVSPEHPLEKTSEPMSGPGALSSLWLPRFSLLPPLPLPLPVQGNVFVPARRARCQSNSSASSSL
jgi:hypothetical protein